MLPTAEELQERLRLFNLLGYSDASVEYQNNNKGGKILCLTEDSWKYEDEFYGGEPYSGNETIWLYDHVVFRCVYWGKVNNDIQFSDIYAFLREALKQGTSGKCVHRGPELFVKGELKYSNECEGTIEEFKLTEKIYLNDNLVYQAHFIGGRVNVRN